MQHIKIGHPLQDKVILTLDPTNRKGFIKQERDWFDRVCYIPYLDIEQRLLVCDRL